MRAAGVLVSALLVAGVVGFDAPAGSRQASPKGIGIGTCSRAIPPVYGEKKAQDGSVQQFLPDTAAADPVPPGAVNAEPSARMDDFDGDGRADQVRFSADDSEMIVVRGDGQVRLAAPAGDSVAISGLLPWGAGTSAGDLDADGRAEVLAVVYAKDRPAEDPRFYVVPGATKAGVHQLVDVGIALPGDLVGVQDSLSGPHRPATVLVASMGDQVGGPGDDLLVQHRASDGTKLGYALVDGGELVAPGPGGSVAALDFTEAPGIFDPDPEPLWFGEEQPAMVSTAIGADGAAVIRVSRKGRSKDFSFPAGLEPPTHLFGWVVPSGRYLEVHFGSGLYNTPPPARLLWDLDAPCGAAAGGASPPPATPVDGAPAFTG